MTDFLVKRFVKEYQKFEDENVRTRYGIFSGVVGICCNLFLFVVKLLVGMFANSISVMADAFNNLSDAASSMISIVGVKLAGKPADEDHPFGHGRIEYISAFIVAFIVIQVGFTLFKTSFGKIRNPEQLNFQILTVGLLVLSVMVKLWMSVFNRKLGKRIHSSVMIATAADSLGDVFTTSATIVSLLIFGIFGINIDGIIGVAVSVVVMIAGVNIAKDTLTPLIGEAVSPETYKQISNFVSEYDGIVGTHDLIVHNYGPSRSMASIHAEVPNDVGIEKSHEVIDQIEREAYRCLGIFLVIHMDPVEMKNELVLEFKAMTGQVLKELDDRLGFHDFRMVEGIESINLIFDLVVPRDYTKENHPQLKEEIQMKMKDRDSRCCCVITVENSFCAETGGK